MKTKLTLILAGLYTLLSNPSLVLAQTTDSLYSYSSASDAQYSQAAGAIGTIGFVIACLFIIIWIGVCIWVYKDAKKRNISNPILWALLTYFLLVVGLIVYLLAGRKSGTPAPVATTPVSSK